MGDEVGQLVYGIEISEQQFNKFGGHRESDKYPEFNEFTNYD